MNSPVSFCPGIALHRRFDARSQRQCGSSSSRLSSWWSLHASFPVMLLALLALMLSPPAATAQGLLPAPPNLVQIDDRLTTSGQPSAAWLETLGARGVEAVIYLAPLAVGDSVPDEPQILARQGIEFIHIPIPFNQPTVEDFDRFSTAMTRLAEKKILVHCQINLRASSMVFLYRTIVRHETPQAAFEAVEKVWVPSGGWQRFITERLAANGIVFDPF